MEFDYEVLIIGGGPAGLSAAMSLGRLSRTALVCDDNRPRNAPSTHVNNFPSQDGIHPAEWRKKTRKDLEKYKTIGFFEGAVLSVHKVDQGFVAQLSSGATRNFKKVILAYGIQDKLLSAPGFKELWGKSIFHCPFCHGFEVRGASLGLIANGELAAHGLPMIYGLSKDLILFTNGKTNLSEDLQETLRRRNVEVIEEPIDHLIYEGEVLKVVVLIDGQKKERDALFVAPIFPFQSKSPIGESLGCEKTELGFYKVGERGETTVKGVFAAGDNMTMMQSVLLACASGVAAAAGVIFSLVSEDFHG
ncbi:NAD(P)/FAD-dependent oxidoreductase [Bdellovibrio bacteriovorus]|uniref:NAD(P)/FAD-dependent oxidoreductase n=1 Tax=Bdellovibrio bacteriovorus TaxID=959 RepID=UPI0035A8A49E